MRNVLKVALIALLVLITLLYGVDLYFGVSRSRLLVNDFESFYAAAHMLRDGMGESLYSIERQAQYQNSSYVLPFRTLPITALIYLPFSIFTVGVAYNIFMLVNAGLVILFAYIVSSKFPTWRLLVFLSVLAYWPVKTALFLGQPSIILMFVLFMALHYGTKRKPFLYGLLCSLLLIKFQYIILIPFLVVLAYVNKFTLEYIKGLLSGGMFILLLCLSLVGLDALLTLPGFILHTESIQYGSLPEQMLSIQHLLMRSGISQVGSILLSGFLYLVLLVYAVKKGTKKSTYLCLIIIPFFAYHVLLQDMVLLIPPFVYWLLEKNHKLFTVLRF